MNPPPSSSPGIRGRHLGLAAILCAGAAIRLAGLSTWWINPDEGIYYSILTRAEFGGFWQEAVANAHPPLYYLILRGLGSITWDFVWLRGFSVVCGLVAVAGAWAVARQLARGGLSATVAGLVAAGVLALAPGAVELSRVIRPYMLQLALLSWALHWLLRYLARPDGRALTAYVGLLCLALLTHYSSVLALGVFGLIVVGHGASARGAGSRAGSGRAGHVRRLVAAHAVPVALVGFLYLVHVRPLASSALADEALDGWLAFYMIDAPTDAWLSLLGFQHLLAGPWLRAPMAVFLLAAVVLALRGGQRTVALGAGGGVLVATVGAALGVYPFGSTRHSAWLLAFTVPALGWLAGLAARSDGLAARSDGLAARSDGPAWRRAGSRLAVPALIVAFGGPLGTLLGAGNAPWAPPDQVLRRADLVRMIDVLDPSSRPELVLMSAQTFYLLLPFYPSEREAAVFSADSSAFHFPYGERRVLVSRGWDFTLSSERTASEADAPPPAGAETRRPTPDTTPDTPAGDLGTFLRTVERDLPSVAATDRARAVLLVGGWRPPFVDSLGQLSEDEPFILELRNVPGLFAFVVDPRAMAAALRLPVPDGG